MVGCEHRPCESNTPVEQTLVLTLEETEMPFIMDVSLVLAEARCIVEKPKNKAAKINMAEMFFGFTNE